MIYPFARRYDISPGGSYTDHLADPNRASFPGVDLLTPLRTPIYAMCDCWLDIFTDENGTVYLVQLSHDHTRYDLLHVDEVINPQRFVKEGDLVGYTGNSGFSTGPHCHISKRLNWSPDHILEFVDCTDELASLPLLQSMPVPEVHMDIQAPPILITPKVLPISTQPVEPINNSTQIKQAGIDMATAYGYSQATGMITGAVLGILIQYHPDLIAVLPYLSILLTPTVNVALLVGKKLYQHSMAKLSIA